MDINKFISNQIKAFARNDLIGMLADVGQALWGTGLKFSGAKHRNVLVGQLMVNAAAALEECWKREGLVEAVHSEEEFVRVNWEKLDRIANRKLWEAGANQIDSTRYGDLANCAAAQKPVTNGDRIRAMTDEELAGEFRLRICDAIPPENCLGRGHSCIECLVKWLGSPAKQEDT